MFFIPMSAALVNDESTKCRKLTALAIKSLLQKVRTLAAEITLNAIYITITLLLIVSF